MKSYMVIGLGRFGTEVARQLHNLGCEVLAVDNCSDLVQQVSADVTHAVVADARDKEVLKALGAKDFDCAVISIGGDLGNSVLATMNVKELGVPKVVCKAHDDTHRQVLLKLGADQVVIPEQENAGRLARSLSSACPQELAWQVSEGAECPCQAGREHHCHQVFGRYQCIPLGRLCHPK